MDIKKLQSKIKTLTDKIKILESENSSRKNQYQTIFREFKKIKNRVGYLESQHFTQKQEIEKHFTHLEDEMISLQSTLEFFSTEGEGEITGHEEIEETKEDKKESQRRMIMGVDFSDAIAVNLLPEKTKIK